MAEPQALRGKARFRQGGKELCRAGGAPAQAQPSPEAQDAPGGPADVGKRAALLRARRSPRGIGACRPGGGIKIGRVCHHEFAGTGRRQTLRAPQISGGNVCPGGKAVVFKIFRSDGRRGRIQLHRVELSRIFPKQKQGKNAAARAKIGHIAPHRRTEVAEQQRVGAEFRQIGILRVRKAVERLTGAHFYPSSTYFTEE